MGHTHCIYCFVTHSLGNNFVFDLPDMIYMIILFSQDSHILEELMAYVKMLQLYF